jgi:hypothetical protein
MTRRSLHVVAAVLAAVLTVACGVGAGPTSPSTPGQTTASISGVITGEVPASTKISGSTAPLPGVEVRVSDGVGAGTKATTDSSGRFTLTVPPGALRVSVSRSGYQTWESSQLSAAVGQSTTVPTVVLKTRPWAMSGVVTDGVGRPFAGVAIRFDVGDAWGSSFGTVTTDASGRYRLASTQPHFTIVSLSLSGTAVDPILSHYATCCSDAGDTVLSFQLPRVVAVALAAPAALAVGDTVELPAATITYDDGSTRNVYLQMTSSAPEVLATGRGPTGFTMTAVREGSATVAVDYRGVVARRDVRVDGRR